MPKPHYNKSFVPDYASAAAEVFRLLRGDRGEYSPAEFVKLVSSKLALRDDVVTNKLSAREVVGAGDGKHWDWVKGDWTRAGRWRVRV